MGKDKEGKEPDGREAGTLRCPTENKWLVSNR